MGSLLSPGMANSVSFVECVRYSRPFSFKFWAGDGRGGAACLFVYNKGRMRTNFVSFISLFFTRLCSLEVRCSRRHVGLRSASEYDMYYGVQSLKYFFLFS